MIEAPRLALAISAAEPEPSAISLALLSVLAGRGARVQHFRTRACPTATELVGQVTGLPGRHLDSWLMPPPVCRSLFLRGCQGADFAIVEGTLQAPLPLQGCGQCELPGNLRPLASLLDLPIVAVLDLESRRGEDFHLPPLPERTEAVVIDRLRDPEQLPRFRRLIELTCKVPVLGALEELPSIRRLLDEARVNQDLSDDVLPALAENFLTHCDLRAIDELAHSRTFPESDEMARGCDARHPGRGFRVAYAQDDAFGRYFPDTLESLEALGARLIEFSPLRDEALPEGVDLVMIGCGMPDQYADQLSSNLSMMAALKQHVCDGQRIYSEGGGTAYLGRWMVIEGRPYRGVGILPFDAELLPQPCPPFPVRRKLLHDSWLGPRGTVFRGYKSGRWKLRSSIQQFECPACFGSLTSDGDLFYHHHAVGSLIHLHLAALPEVVAAFAGPHRPSLKRPTARGRLNDPSDLGA